MHSLLIPPVQWQDPYSGVIPPVPCGHQQRFMFGNVIGSFSLPDEWRADPERPIWTNFAETTSIALSSGPIDSDEAVMNAAVARLSNLYAMGAEIHGESVSVEHRRDGSDILLCTFEAILPDGIRYFEYSYTIPAGRQWVQLSAFSADGAADPNLVFTDAFHALESFRAVDLGAEHSDLF